tara:strand:- start:121 stop:843 length:723 start_codon:yes stop_codon:yes gene_type:complete
LKKRKAKKSKSKFPIAIIGAIIIGVIVFYFYSADQAKIRGSVFSNEIQILQENIALEQNRFISTIVQWEEGNITNEDMISVGESHLGEFNKLLGEYDKLQPPDAFSPSVRLLKLSLEYQIQSHELRLNWIKTGDESELIRSSELTQLSFEAEQTGLRAFNDAKAGMKMEQELQKKLTKEEYEKAKGVTLDNYRYQEAACIKSLGAPFENMEQESEYEDCIKYVEENKERSLKNLENRCCI